MALESKITMRLLLFIVAFFLVRYFVISKRPVLKGKVNGVIFIPLFSLFLCYDLFEQSDEFVNQTLTRIDSLRYISTYTPYLGEDIHAISQIAQNSGYMSDEIVSRSSEIGAAFAFGDLAKLLSIIAFICCIIWIVNIWKLLFKNQNNEKLIKFSALITFCVLLLGLFFLSLGTSNFLKLLSSDDSSNAVSFVVLLIYTPIAIAIIYGYYRSYNNLCLFLKTNCDKEEI